MGVYGKRTEPAYADFDAPESYARNDHILVWWLPAYDDVLRSLVAQWAWAWPWEATSSLEKVIPANVIDAWKRSDPLCTQYAHYNVLMYFAVARAKQLGLSARKAVWKVCPVCNERFIESSLPFPILKRVGVASIDCCSPCYESALLGSGSTTRTADQIVATLRALTAALQRNPKSGDLHGPRNLPDLESVARIATVKALAAKPSLERVRAVFGSWDAAINAASGQKVPILEDGPVSHPTPIGPPAVRQDWIRLWSRPSTRGSQTATDRLDEIDRIQTDVRLLLGSGEIKLARNLLQQLCSKPDPSPWECETLAEVLSAEGDLPSAIDLLTQYAKYVRSTRTATWRDEVRSIEIAKGRLQEGDSAQPWRAFPPDVYDTGALWRPLPHPPRGKAVFVLVGGAMYFTDFRGGRGCFSGRIEGDGQDDQLAESIARLDGLIESKAWIRAAVTTAHRIQRIAQRNGATDAWVHSIGYATGWFRDIVKEVTGRPPTKLRKSGVLDKPATSRWLYDRDPLQFVLHKIRGNGSIEIKATPAVALWRFPDRSDQSLQAYCDTLAGNEPEPLVVVLPDVPACREFALRYNRRLPMTRVGRTWIEDLAVFAPANLERGHESYGRHHPTLVVTPDLAEVSGDYLDLALDYLDENYQLHVSPWDLIQDPLMRAHLDERMPALNAKRDAERPWTIEEAERRTEDARRYAPDAEFMIPSARAGMFREYVPQAIVTRYGQF